MRTKENLIKSIAIFTGFGIMFYLLISFYYLTINPKEWGEGARFLYAWFLLIFIAISISNYNINKL